MVIFIKTIKEKVIYEYNIKGSKFISILLPVDNESDIKLILNEIKKEYKKATHYCTAYVIDNISRYDDDGEPIKTGGFPILNILLKNDFNKCFCVIIRYFGGTLLGTGGLIKAYSTGVLECIKLSECILIEPKKRALLCFSYENINIIEYLLKDFEILTKDFDTNIKFVVDIPIDYNINELEKYCNISFI